MALGIGGNRAGVGERPLEILKRRYAQGEISREDFERMKRDIEDPLYISPPVHMGRFPAQADSVVHRGKRNPI